VSEKELIESFKTYLVKKGVSEDTIKIGQTKNPFMDIEFPINGLYFCLEAKYSDDTERYQKKEKIDSNSRDSQNALSVFGSLLKGINLPISNRGNGLPFKYGVLIAKSLKKQYKKHWNKIGLDNWNKFGEEFNIEFVFVADLKNGKYMRKNWKNFLK